MSSNWTGYVKIVAPTQPTDTMADNTQDGQFSTEGKSPWYKQLMGGSTSRLNQYTDYDRMDADIEISRSLDVIAKEIAGNSMAEDKIIKLTIHEHHKESVSESLVATINESLQHWISVQELEARIFKIARLMIKYGDVFFVKEPGKTRWLYVPAKQIKDAIVDKDDNSEIIAWRLTEKASIKAKKKKVGGYTVVDLDDDKDKESKILVIANTDVVRFSLNDDMSESAPFGESILRAIYKTHKQKELLEDSIIIYRIQRAPERRVFNIQVGNMPPAKVKKHLASIKNDIRQSHVPTNKGDGQEIASVYNPESQSEDYFFATRGDGQSSTVTTLPGGSGLGEITDLEYFQRKEWRGLRIPASYMMDSTDGGAQFNDGKVGMAYIQEMEFATYIKQLQSHLNIALDREFKIYLRDAGVKVNNSMFKIEVREPSNFGTYRQQELDASLLNSVQSADGIDYLAKEFVLKKYLQLDDVDLAENARLLAKQNGVKVDDDSSYAVMYGDAEPEEGDDMGGDMGGAAGGDMDEPDMSASGDDNKDDNTPDETTP